MVETTQSKLYKEKILDQYTDLIELMYSKHILFTGKWLSRQSGVMHFNLKKTEVRTIISASDEGSHSIQKDFYEYMINYKGELIHLYVDIINEIKQKYDVTITGRIKNEDSILNKLEKKSNEFNGAFPINKVLNDLLGFRIIEGNYGDNIKIIYNLLESLKGKKGYRIVHKERMNGEYRGYHIYLMGKDAKFFPLELQLWDTKNEKTNLDSHEIYKKDYTSWPEIYNKG
jgi:Region found in RelA / SpoT proteins